MKRPTWAGLNAWRQRSLGFKPNKGQLKRTPLRPISKKRARSLPARREAIEQRVEGQRCAGRILGVCAGIDTEFNAVLLDWVVGHEPLFRSRGGDETDPDQVIPLCRPCHDWVHAHSKQAESIQASDGSGPLAISQYNRKEG